uniref:Sodium/calcium exchanger membrane region domain-containing protein n=1 Tax=Aplanochytrium stocchinoi TaxID=215587 RepID=A0A7S3PRD0_9STRA|mmetsp:Transcript_34023/g.41986  ORF Transcript_34023/g.41986 Transcript_34023/m.41986 type:complete len:834 (-) Transcript_34023:585-3086(-)|eukprot:CAMPEP_0204825718 /NCGR_PEP_ID=MMETSP1346-20131115/3534_1 /ASSEMBLY_ACC=CAM_ASM_000771 /TAXON_ID=215587 /ORGANISM="Aplanochytrium stocchinoi, Strain GSBS06" /LENGTH=833 /DNA_ID=CAMNT_0051953433 /DNA_START=392 /DNA_END=2893 /DNA_ORIENTATION=+
MAFSTVAGMNSTKNPNCRKRKRHLGLRLGVFGVGLALVSFFGSNRNQNQRVNYSLRERERSRINPYENEKEGENQNHFSSSSRRVLASSGSGDNSPTWLPSDENNHFYEVCGQNSSFCLNSTNGCEYPDDYPLTCCNGENFCLAAEHEDECEYNHLCIAHLVPGDSGAAECLKSWETSGGLALYIFLLLYCFVGLAIVCDDYFVPSLEKISEGLSLPEDVAGATFMAAGSSAPELFVSLADNVISNPPKSVGIGTIVGSAIFNILVIVGLSALLAGQALALNWRPFARDAGFYFISIVVLILVVNDGVIKWWEGLILLSIYVLYVVFMFYNEGFFSWLDRKLGVDRKIEGDGALARIGREATPCNDNIGESGSTVSSKTDSEGGENGISINNNNPSEWATELMLTDKNNNDVVDAARVVVAAEDGGNTDSLGGNSSVRQFHTVETSRPTKAVEAAAEAMKIGKKHGSESNLFASMRRESSGIHGENTRIASSKNPLHMSKYRGGWKGLRREGSQTIKLKDVAHAVLRANTASKIWIQAAQEGQRARMVAENNMGVINENETRTLSSQELAYGNSNKNMAGESRRDEEDESLGSYWECLVWPMHPNLSGVEENQTTKQVVKKRSICSRACGDWKTLWKARAWYIVSLPLNVCFRFTIPDCNYDIFCEDKEGKEENRKIGYSLTFIGCVVWIAILSHFLVYFAAKFGCIVGISPAVMGLTILAAGTSVPDALSSVLVARNGQGDMAVANSIGSNVFDILIGLGLPWMMAGLIYDTPSIVGVDDLWVGIGFLFGVLFCLIIALLASKWILRRSVGAVLIALYCVYVAFELFIHPNI